MYAGIGISRGRSNLLAASLAPCELRKENAVNLQTDSSRHYLQQRLAYFYIPVIAVFVIFAARLWQLQIIGGAEYALQAERNRVRTIQLVAPRGTITDRYGNPLVENRPSFNILLYRESIKDIDATAEFVTTRLGMRSEDFDELMRRSRSTGLYRPVVIKEDVGIDDISVVEAHRREHPELELGPEPRRLYRYGTLASHVLGYVGEISDDELSKEVFPGARIGDLVGKFGVERTYNQPLTGGDGSRVVLVDSVGREMGILNEIDSVIGSELRLTLDLELQAVAEAMLADKVGAIVAMDPRDGEILAMASAPSFDPNSLSTRISLRDWNRLVSDPRKPLQNRAIQNAYPPGSTFKLIMAETGLDEGFVDEMTRVTCAGMALYYNRPFRCIRQGHGTVYLESAIARSCNIFFYELGRRMGISLIAQHAQMLGFGERTGIDLPGERSGIMPSPEWKQRVRGAKWFGGETISVAIGQGAVTSTPLQLLRAVSCLATGGKLTTPHVFLRSERVPGASTLWPSRQVAIEEASMRRIREGMWQSVNAWGTGHAAAVPGLDICGKTGTVQVIGNERRKDLEGDPAVFEDHSWFVGFASKDHPEIAVVVFVEHGGKGGVSAAPIAREMFNSYFAGKKSPTLITEAVQAATADND